MSGPSPSIDGERWTALVLSGGRGRRLGMGEKSDVVVGGRRMLDHVIDGLPEAEAVVVVGPDTSTARPVRFALEEPRFGGPVAAVAAGMAMVTTSVVVVLATDMPRAPALVETLLAALAGTDADAVVPIEQAGTRQPLCAAYRSAALRRALRALGDPAGRSMHDLIAGLRAVELPLDAAQSALVADVDTPEDLRAIDSPDPDERA